MENTNSVQTLTSESTVGTRSNSTEEALGFNDKSAMITAENIPQGLQQYVRFTRNGQKCSGVLSGEYRHRDVMDTGPVKYDVYLYTARHCFEKANPISGATWDFDVKSHNSPLIGSSQALGFNGVNPVTLPIHSDYIERLELPVAGSGWWLDSYKATYRDVVRLYQYSESRGQMLGLCNNEVRSGKRVTLGYPNPKLKTPNGVVVTISETIDPNLVSLSAGLNGVSLQSKMNQWLGTNKVSIDPDIVKLADTTTLPGESGSPVFDGKVTTTRALGLTCIDGILTREITKLGKPSETYYTVLSKSASFRKWERVWSLGGKSQKPERNLVTWDPARTASSIRLLHPGAASQAFMAESTPTQVKLSLQDMNEGGSVVI